MKYAIIVFAIAMLLVACKPPEQPTPIPERVIEGITIQGDKGTVALPALAPGQVVEYKVAVTRKNSTITYTSTWEGISETVNGTECVGWTKKDVSSSATKELKRLYCEPKYRYKYAKQDGEWMLRDLVTVNDFQKALNPIERTKGEQAIEDVTVEAGTFAALKTTRENSARTVTDWYSPKIPIIGLVKSVEEQHAPYARIEFELVRVESS